ncbi:ComEA family DNA-binding protein [Paenibacillus nasutitermitis]|uniref:Helix-hairpin-helix DNA-binding motif class 1 domain-containing protein n=1 Tax=Paenibacillus nasutitermitis TaxID=1652958 RepID=A0A916Z1J1_9BACL|nr:helix-hairpin-helix domain-containing protein [Paenibacillus nasutitermitis]GGD71772.1 hypothetical protein GCM10010911_32150 [Paenibacillus nasutitermitis]
MQANRKKRPWNPMYTIASLGLLGAALIISAFYQAGTGEPPGWVPLNSQVKAALNPDESKPDSSAADFTSAEKKQAESEKELPSPTGNQAIDKDPQPNGPEAGETASKQPLQQQAVGADRSDTDDGGPGADKTAPAAMQDEGMTADGKINLNRATAAELDALPGIGEAKARAIVADREKNGPFRSVDDLLRVKGIGPKLLEKMKASIVVTP